MQISMEQIISNLHQLHTVPVYPNQKRPATRNGYKNGVKNGPIKTWLDARYNVGISLPLSNLACVDVDMHGNDENGLKAYEELCKKYGEINSYKEITATGNGLHIVVKDEGITANNCILAPGVEFKRNGLIVCSPSTINGVQYKIIGGVNPDGSYKFANLNSAWLDLINSSSKKKKKPQRCYGNSSKKCQAQNYGCIEYQKVFDNCRFLRYVKINSETLNEPIWFTAVNMLAKDINSDYIIHWLSEDYPQYSFDETQNKIAASRSSGKFCGCNYVATAHYDICKGCPKAEQIIKGEK